jgi:CheY-like chemotaxis protein
MSIGEEATTVNESHPKFPARSAAESCCVAATNETSAISQRRPGILVVDDDAPVRVLLDVGLRHYGFTVWQAADGQEALHVYQQNRSAIDAVLLDVRMPRLDGPQTLAALTQLNPQIRCCFMTGQAGTYSEDQLLALGAAHVFYKPFQLAKIAQALGNLIGISLPRLSGPVP